MPSRNPVPKLNFQVPPHLPRMVAEAAQARGLSVSAWLRGLVLEALEQPAEDGGLPDPPDAEEIVRLLGREARAGSVPALKYLHGLGIDRGRMPVKEPDAKAEPADGFEALDELAPRRQSRT